MTALRSLPVLPLVALLAACGSGGGAGGGGAGGGGPGGGFAGHVGYAERAFDRALAAGYSDPARLPPSGRASYAGVIGLDVDAVPGGGAGEYDLAGRLDLTTSFADGAIEGSASGFRTADERPVAGSLEIDAGEIDRGANPEEEWTWVADLTGTLQDGAGEPLQIDAELYGDFYGQGQDFVAGGVIGAACVPGLDCTTLGGEFVAERDD